MAPRRFFGYLTAAGLILLAARPSAGQAFIPATGDGTVSVSFQSVRTSPQLDVNGVKGIDPDGSRDITNAQALIWHVEYGLTDKIAVHASLPFVMARYEGPFPHLYGRDLQLSDLDDGTYHGAFQDFYFGARYALHQSSALAVTPFVEVVIPSHRYETVAQTAVGRDMRVLLVGSALGGFLDGIVPGLYYQTRISYGFAQEVAGYRMNRTGIDSAVGYFVSPRFAVQFLQTFQYFNNGVFVVFEPDGNISGGGTGGPPLSDLEGYLYHDQLMRSRSVTLGGGATYVLSDSVGLFATATTMAWGRSLQRPERSVTIGVNWGFQTRRSASRP